MFLNKISLFGVVDKIKEVKHDKIEYISSTISFPDPIRKKKDDSQVFSKLSTIKWAHNGSPIPPNLLFIGEPLIFSGRIISKKSFHTYILSDEKAMELCLLLGESTRFSKKIRDIISILKLQGLKLPVFNFAMDVRNISDINEFSDCSNDIQLYGEVLKEPYLKTTPTGIKRLYFPLLVPSIGRNNKTEEHVFDIVLYGEKAVFFKDILFPRRKIFVKGSLSSRLYKSSSPISLEQLRALSEALNVDTNDILVEKVLDICGFNIKGLSWFVYDIVAEDIYIAHP